MNKRYWDHLADSFEEDCLNVFRHDENGVLARRIRLHAPRNGLVGDFGCGTGRAIRLLAASARRVYAVDLSERNLEVARANCAAYKNVEYTQCDLQRGRPAVPRLHMILAVNVLILPRASERLDIFVNMRDSLRVRGILLLLVPSLESQMWYYQNLLELEVHRRADRGQALSEVRSVVRAELQCPAEGIVRLAGVDTKFFLGPEVDGFLTNNGFDVVERVPIEYAWEEELLPSDWGRTPGPWHWLVVGRKRASRSDGRPSHVV